MDVVATLNAFRLVAQEQSFTRGAERCGVPQPVVSRRVAVLERYLGGPLFERTSRSVSLTELGERVLPHAAELLGQWELIESAARDGSTTLVIAVPPGLDPRILAAVRRGLARATVTFTEAGKQARLQAWKGKRADAALLIATPAPGTIGVPLGLGLADGMDERTDISLSTLRRGRRERDRPPRVVHMQEEDDTPAVRDPLERQARAHGLRRDQVEMTASRTEALTRVHENADALLCTSAEADAAGLGWAPVRGLELRRCYQLVERTGALSGDESRDLQARLTKAVTGQR